MSMMRSIARRHAALALVIALAVALVGCAGGDAPRPASTPGGAASCVRGRTFIVVRHAEKASVTEKDPPLSEKGRARAEVLAAMLAHANVTRLVATPYKRTQETLAPLGAELRLPVEVRPADGAASLVAELRRAPDGAVVVVASHSNVVPAIVRELAHAELRGVSGANDMLPEDEYGRVLVVAEACGATRPSVVELSSDR